MCVTSHVDLNFYWFYNWLLIKIIVYNVLSLNTGILQRDENRAIYTILTQWYQPKELRRGQTKPSLKISILVYTRKIGSN